MLENCIKQQTFEKKRANEFKKENPKHRAFEGYGRKIEVVLS